MPWLALPYAERKRKEELSSRFGVEGIPSLVLLDKDLSVITTNGRSIIDEDLAQFPFHPKPVKDLASPDGINETPSVIVLAEGIEGDASSLAMEPVAKECVATAKASGGDPEFLFFVARASSGPAGQIRKLCGLPDADGTPALLLLDIPDNGG